MSADTHMIWVDLEMTGLDPESDEIIEIASLITDGQLNIIAEGPELIVHQPEERFAKMDDWNQKQHTKSGLWEKVVASKISIEEAEAQTLAFLKQHLPARKIPLCGNSIHQDKRFINRYMKQIDAFLHYRMVDVSSIKELVNRWYPGLTGFTKKETHRAMDDIRESIAELKFYREKIFKEKLG